MPEPFPEIEFFAFHEKVLPGLLASGHGAAIVPGLAQVEPLAIRITETGEIWSYVPKNG